MLKLMIIADHIIFAGSITLFTMALIQLFLENKKINNYFIAVLYLIISFIFMHDFIIDNKLCEYCSGSGLIILNVKLWQISLDQFIRILEYSIGPLFLLYYQSLTSYDFKFKKNNLFHFFPFLLSFFVSMLIIVELFIPESNKSLSKDILNIIEVGGRIHFLVYLIVILSYIHFFKISVSKKLKSIKLLSFIIVFIILIIIFSCSVLGLILQTKLHLIMNSSISLLFIFLFIIERRYPELSQWMSILVVKERYEHSLLKGHNKSLLKARLYSLMETEKRYLDETLTLEKLASEVSLTPHQLSEFINAELDSNFNSYINEFRIQNAKDIIKDDKNYSILQIAFLVGFNSKSSFYESFKKITGQTPLEYRKKLKGPINLEI